MRDLNELRLDERGSAFPRPDFSEPLLGEVEEMYRVRLPETYVEFLRFRNGGRPKVSRFQDAERGSSVSQFFHLESESAYSLSYTYSIIDNTDAFRKLLYEDSEGFFREKATGYLVTNTLGGGREDDTLEEAAFEAQVIAIAVDGGGNVIFLDVAPEAGPVYIFYYDGETILPIADSFEAFIDSLEEG